MGSRTNEVIPLLKEFKKNVNAEIEIDKMILFGSRAKGKARKTSDVDILLISRDFKGKKYFKRSPVFYRMWNYTYDVDIICLTPEEFEKKKEQISIIQEAARDGIEI